jgi:hypothetical protein
LSLGDVPTLVPRLRELEQKTHASGRIAHEIARKNLAEAVIPLVPALVECVEALEWMVSHAESLHPDDGCLTCRDARAILSRLLERKEA